MITHDARWSLSRGKNPVPSPWQATRLGQHWAGSMITLAGTDVVHLLIAGARIQTCRSDLPVRLSCFGAVPLGGLLGGCA